MFVAQNVGNPNPVYKFETFKMKIHHTPSRKKMITWMQAGKLACSVYLQTIKHSYSRVIDLVTVTTIGGASDLGA